MVIVLLLALCFLQAVLALPALAIVNLDIGSGDHSVISANAGLYTEGIFKDQGCVFMSGKCYQDYECCSDMCDQSIGSCME
ncbi:hypothetical protein BGX27_007420 [Mortierella sp. AM989]|nr:hypothetical protein BGX27_007420 [Mortierella sp. AM989]